MNPLRTSIAARMVLAYGLLSTLSVMAVSAVFYFGTIGVLDQSIDAKIHVMADRLLDMYRHVRPDPLGTVAGEIERQLNDGIDSDREIYLLLGPDGRRLGGNLRTWPGFADAYDGLRSYDVVQRGQLTRARIDVRWLAGGALLVVGRDMTDQVAIRRLVWRALGIGAGLSLLLTALGALLFRRLIERRIGRIRRTALAIEGGDLSRRVTVTGNDEFSLLGSDINRMLDRIEHLMDGVRHVSNAIAHDLRTPLGRIRSKLDEALRQTRTVDGLAGAAHGAIDEIDDLIRLFERLLQIAEAESGMRTQTFATVDLDRIASDMVEMYEASAEDQQVTLVAVPGGAAHARGDRNLLASAVASLIDNALKYAGPGARIEVRTATGAGLASIAVCDDGPGIPPSERDNVTQRFYRLDKSRSLPGNGLGLSIVSATATVHGGVLELADNRPGLVARIALRAAQADLADA